VDPVTHGLTGALLAEVGFRQRFGRQVTLMLHAFLVALLLVATTMPALGGERWGWLGVRIRDLAEAEMDDLAVKLGLREGYGVVLAEIMKDTPAASSDLRAGDLIVAIDGRPVVETRGLQRVVGSTAAGRELTLVVVREGRRRELRVRVGQMPPEIVAERVAAEFGFLVRDSLGDDAPAGAAGRPPVVAAVGERSSASRGGLAVGDRIVAINGQEVATLEGFRLRVQELLLRDEIQLRVQRKGELLSLVLPPARPALPLQ